MKSAIPARVSTDTADAAMPGFSRGERMVRSTIVPPSPLSESDMASRMYWAVITRKSVQVIRVRSPRILGVVGRMKSRIAPMV